MGEGGKRKGFVLDGMVGGRGNVLALVNIPPNESILIYY